MKNRILSLGILLSLASIADAQACKMSSAAASVKKINAVAEFFLTKVADVKEVTSIEKIGGEQWLVNYITASSETDASLNYFADILPNCSVAVTRE